jgi:enoyl-CoA hydratase
MCRVIDLAYRNNVAVLTMAHGKANAFDLELCEALCARFEECSTPPVAAVVVTGHGSIFSAGVDLLRVVNGGAAYIDQFLPALSRAFETVFAFSKPLVAAVNGHAIAGGCILACAADRRLMARGNGRIGIPELLVGVPFPTVPIEIVRSVLAPADLARLVYTGETLVADSALECNLVDTVCDPDRLVEDAVRAADALAAMPAQAFAITKRHLREPFLARIREHRARLDSEVQRIWSSPETIATIREYVNLTLKK